MGLEEPSYFADYIGDYNVLVGPMLYKNNAEYNAVMDSDIVKDLNAKLASDYNIHVLDTHYSFGFRSVCTNKVVTKPADLNGLIMRSTESPLFVKTITCLGATPSAMSFTECLSAMSSGVVDGFEGSVSTLKDTGAYEYTKKVANTNHFIATRWLFMAEDVYPVSYTHLQDPGRCGSCEKDLQSGPRDRGRDLGARNQRDRGADERGSTRGDDPDASECFKGGRAPLGHCCTGKYGSGISANIFKKLSGKIQIQG